MRRPLKPGTCILPLLTAIVVLSARPYTAQARDEFRSPNGTLEGYAERHGSRTDFRAPNGTLRSYEERRGGDVDVRAPNGTLIRRDRLGQ